MCLSHSSLNIFSRHIWNLLNIKRKHKSIKIIIQNCDQQYNSTYLVHANHVYNLRFNLFSIVVAGGYHNSQRLQILLHKAQEVVKYCFLFSFLFSLACILITKIQPGWRLQHIMHGSCRIYGHPQAQSWMIIDHKSSAIMHALSNTYIIL